MELRERNRGALLGLAVGDALGTTLEFRRPGTFTPITDMVGGGPFGLKAGQWTDDTSIALWAFHRSTSFREGALLAVNLGDDADTPGAVYGQLAGAYYGDQGIPPEWLAKLAHRELVEGYADRVYERSQV
jgi:ADP-ribosylglycohydrolase